jgi:hypothetical protein
MSFRIILNFNIWLNTMTFDEQKDWNIVAEGIRLAGARNTSSLESNIYIAQPMH